MAENREQQKNIGKFKKAIFDYANLQSEQIIEEIREQEQKELEFARQVILKETEEETRRHVEKANSEIFREIAHREQVVKQELLKQRRHYTQEIFAEVKKRLEDFVKTEEYLPFLLEQAAKICEAFETDDAVISLRKEDEGLKEKIQAALGRSCTFRIDPTIHIGGLRVTSAALGKMADQSLDSLLHDQQDWFAMHSSMSVL